MDKFIRRHEGDIIEREDERGPYFIIPTGDGIKYPNIDEARIALKRWRERFKKAPPKAPPPEPDPDHEPPKPGM